MKALTAGGVLSRYGLSVVATLAAWLIRLPFSSLLTDKAPFLAFSDLLAFSQVDQESKACGTVELDECLGDALRNLDSSIRETRATIHASPLPGATGHRGPLVQLPRNLIGNSLECRGEAPPRVDIRAEANDTEWRLQVADKGIGFEPRYADTIFAPFKRLHGEEYPGNGIGLASCRRIVHSGYLSFSPRHHLSSVGENLNGRPFAANAMEEDSDPPRLARDWMGLLTRSRA